MTEKILACMITSLISISMTGCGLSNKSSSDASMTTYNGTFDETVYDQICRDITMAGKRVTLPCSLNDLGKEFDVKSPIVFSDLCQTTYRLTLNGQDLGGISYCSNRELEGAELRNANITMFSFHSSYQGNPDVSIAGIRLGDSAASIQEKFGSPTTQNERETDWGRRVEHIYSVGEYKEDAFGENKRINFVTYDNVLDHIYFQVPTENYS